MKLYAFNFQLEMAQTHDYAVRSARRNFQTWRQILVLNYQRVIAAGAKRFIQPGEDRLAVVLHQRRFPVAELRSANHASTENLAYGLMTQADPQERNSTGKGLDYFHRDTRV